MPCECTLLDVACSLKLVGALGWSQTYAQPHKLSGCLVRA